MKRRMDRIRRIVGVQNQLQRAAEWALQDLNREAEALREREESILDALGRDNALLLGLAPALTERLSELKARSDGVQAAREQQTDLVIEQAGRRAQAEKIERDLLSQLERAHENARLEEISGGGAAHARQSTARPQRGN